MYGLMKSWLVSLSVSESSSSLIVDNIFLKVLSHDTVQIGRYFNIINNKAVRASTKWHQTTIRPTWPIFQHFQSRNSEQLPVSPISAGEDRDCLDSQVSIQTKMRVKPSEEPISKPSNIVSMPEDQRAKRIPEQYTISVECNKELKHRGKSSQEDSWTDNKKVHPLEPQLRWVVEEDRVEAVVAAVYMYPEAAAEVAFIAPLH